MAGIKCTIHLRVIDKVLEIITLLVLIGDFAWVAFHFGDIPEQIPNLDEPGVFRTRLSVLILPAIALGIYLLLSWLSRFPHKFPYPVKITHANREQLYVMGVRTLRVVKLLLVVMYTYTTYNQIASLLNQPILSQQFHYFVAMAVVMIPILVLVKMIRRGGA